MGESRDTAQSIGLRLREELNRLGISAPQAAAKLGVARNTIYNWFETAQFTAPQSAVLATLGVDLRYVLSLEDSRHKGQELSSEDVAYALPPTLREENRQREERYGASLTVEEAIEMMRNGQVVWVPYYDLPLSGGGGAEALSQPPKKWNFWRRDYIVDQRGLNPVDLAEFPVRGYSMGAVTSVLVDRSRKTVIGTDMFALRVANELFFKYAQIVGDVVRVTSKEAGDHPPFDVPLADFDSGHAEIIGRVMRYGYDR